MSLDNTSHPGRPGPDELVPSRYALRVGEIDVLVVKDGVLSLPGRRRLSLGTGPLGVLTACWVRAELDDRVLLNNWSIAVVLHPRSEKNILAPADH